MSHFLPPFVPAFLSFLDQLFCRSAVKFPTFISSTGSNPIPIIADNICRQRQVDRHGHDSFGNKLTTCFSTSFNNKTLHFRGEYYSVVI